MRFQNHFDAVILFVPEDRVGLGRLLERHVMSNYEAWVNLTVLDSFQERLQVALNVALAGLNGEGAVHHRARRKLIDEPAVHPNYRNGAPVTAGHNGFAQCNRAISLEHDCLLGSVIGAVQSRCV